MNSSKRDPHAARKAEEAQMKRKAQDLKDAGKATAHEAVKEGEQTYDAAKVGPHPYSGISSHDWRTLLTGGLIYLADGQRQAGTSSSGS